MTRGAMKTRVAQILGLTLGDSAYSDPFAMDNAINRITDEFAGPGMDCYWTSETADVVSGTSEYCVPSLYKVKGAYWLDSSGNWRVLIPTTPQMLDRISSAWRSAPTGLTPIYCVFEGVNRFAIYPGPNYSLSAGYKLEGFANTNVSGISTWAADSTECPLPSWCHEAIVYGVAVDLAMTMLASTDEKEAARAGRILPVAESRYRRLRGQAESAAATFHQSTVAPSLASGWATWFYAR